MKWKGKLKKICHQIPVEIPHYKVKFYVSKFLKLRKKESFCRFCGILFYANNPTQLKYPTCEMCSEKRRRVREEEQKRYEEEQRRYEIKKQKNLFTNFCSPSYNYYSLLKIIAKKDIKILTEMPYRDFLKTLYWKIIRRHVLSKRGYKCELCYSNKKLHVHHKTYISHGREHENLEQLIVLCKSCHSRHHSKRDK